MNPDLRQKLAQYLENDAEFRSIYNYTRERFNAATHLTAHNWEHAYRDTINAIAIGEPEGADMSIVLPATVMHDIGFLYGATGKTHGAIGAEKLSTYFGEGGITCDPKKLDRIRACILTHKGSMHGEEPESLEAKVVSDADMLAKFGAIGVYQSIRTFGEFNLTLSEICERLKKHNEQTFTTATGRKLVEPLRRFGAEFIQQLVKEFEPYKEETL